MFKINIHNETAALKAVVVGVAEDFGGIPKLEDCYDPKSREHVVAGTFPSNDSCVKEMNALVSVLENYDVKVYRPENIIGLNQIFSRDIAFAIEDKLVLPNIIEDRELEVEGISEVLNLVDKSMVILYSLILLEIIFLMKLELAPRYHARNAAIYLGVFGFLFDKSNLVQNQLNGIANSTI